MIIDKIQNIILKEKKNIVFYFDADGSLNDELINISATNIKLIIVANNYFELKYKLEFEWKDQPIFLYHPFAKPNETEIKKYPLLDLLKANTELRLDDASEFISEYGLQEYHLPMVKQYIKQLKTRTNQKKLARILDASHFSKDSLKLGLISITLGFNTVVDRNSCMAKWLCLAIDDKSFIKINTTLTELDLELDLMNWFHNLIDIKSGNLSNEFARDTVSKIKYNILTAYIDKPVKNDSYIKLKLLRTADLNRLQAFFHDWENNPVLKENIADIFMQLGEDVKSSNILQWYGDQHEFGYYSEEMIQAIIKNLYQEIEGNAVKIKDDCFRWMQSKSLSQEQKLQIMFLYYTAGVYAVLEGYRSFKFNTAEDYIKEYTNELYKVDLNYRNAVSAFNKVNDSLFEFDEIANNVFNDLNHKYDRFLIELNVEWQQVLKENNFNLNEIEVDKQYDFYKNNLKGFDYKMVVIISDALRYELGHELYNDLLSDSKNNLSIEPSLASIPSYTNIGMTNLLPHSGITVDKGSSDLVFKINDKPSVSTNRTAILQMTEPESKAIDYTEVMKFDRGNGRDFFKNNRIVYIYHDWIDAVGDKKRTEYETFEATTKAKEDIKRLINKLYGWNVYHVLVTSDHGFLFNYNELAESSREIIPKTKGYSREHVRFVVADEFEGKVDGYQLNLKDTTNIDTELKVSVPRAINRYRKQGNVGVQFVHGGASLQELLTPVIKFYKQKKETHQSVSFKRIDSTDKTASGNLKITLLQDQPVSNEFKSSEIVFGLYSDTAELLSKEVIVIFNSTSGNPKERISTLVLSLNTIGSRASYCYLKAFDMKDKNRLNPMGINDLVKISSLMEKDDF